MFLHFELFVFGAQSVLKGFLLCSIKEDFLTLMNEDCRILRYMFAERAFSRLLFGSLCCWLLSSFAYFLAWGDPVIDDPTQLEGSPPLGLPRPTTALQMRHPAEMQMHHPA